MPFADFGDPYKVAHAAISADAEKARRAMAGRRVLLYQDNFEAIVNHEIDRLFRNPTTRSYMYSLAKMAGANSYVKRVVDEIARPVYATPPTRKVDPAGAEPLFQEIAEEVCLDEVQDLTARLIVLCNQVIQYVRYIEKVSMCVDVLTPDMVTVIPFVDRPTVADGICYQRTIWNPAARSSEVRWVCWDDKINFEIDEGGTPTRPIKAHGLAKKPFVEYRRRATWGHYWDTTSGNDLESAQIQLSLINALILKLHKDQGEKQIMYATDEDAIADQALDARALLKFPPNSNPQIADLRSDATHYHTSREALEKSVAANYGITADRLNVDGAKPGDDEGLNQRTAEVMQVMRRGEPRLFDIIKMVSVERPGDRFPDSATITTDFGHLFHRVDRKSQLEIRQIERSMGLRSAVDDIMEDNPGMNRDDALEELRRNTEDEAEFIKIRRALNISSDASVDAPGSNPEKNGALGPAVRDGLITKDTAAAISMADAETQGIGVTDEKLAGK